MASFYEIVRTDDDGDSWVTWETVAYTDAASFLNSLETSNRAFGRRVERDIDALIEDDIDAIVVTYDDGSLTRYEIRGQE